MKKALPYLFCIGCLIAVWIITKDIKNDPIDTSVQERMQKHLDSIKIAYLIETDSLVSIIESNNSEYDSLIKLVKKNESKIHIRKKKLVRVTYSNKYLDSIAEHFRYHPRYTRDTVLSTQ